MGSSFSSTTKETSVDVGDVMVELGLLQDAVGGDEDITDILLRSCWEGIRFVHQALAELSSAIIPLLNVKSNEKKLTLKVNFLNNLLKYLRS